MAVELSVSGEAGRKVTFIVEPASAAKTATVAQIAKNDERFYSSGPHK